MAKMYYNAFGILNAIIYCYKISTIHTLYMPSFLLLKQTDLAQVFQVCLDIFNQPSDLVHNFKGWF